jgi:myo-inositol-1(or 4)-monophosphatase
LQRAGEAAAKLALAFYRHSPQVWEKEGGSPVSEADYAVDKRLGEILLEARPDYGWLSEETADNDARLGRERVFVVDPIDGTRAFLIGSKEWTISLAVVKKDGR